MAPGTGSLNKARKRRLRVTFSTGATERGAFHPTGIPFSRAISVKAEARYSHCSRVSP